MGTDELRPDGGTESPDTPAIRATYHGFFSRGSDPEGLMDMHECTIFVTDEELVVGDQGEYQILGGFGDVLPEELFKILRKFMADDDASTMSYEQAERRSGTRRMNLTDISKIEVEKGMPPLGKTMVEIEKGRHGRELNVFIGTAKSYGDEAETKAFVDELEAAAVDAGGSPIVNEEFDL